MLIFVLSYVVFFCFFAHRNGNRMQLTFVLRLAQFRTPRFSLFFLTTPPPAPPPFPNNQWALSLVSALSSVFIIVTFWKFPRLHTFAYKVIMMLAVANLFLDCAYLMGNVGHDK